MLARSTTRSSLLISILQSRPASSAAGLARLELDINAHHDQDQQTAVSREPVTTSVAALRGQVGRTDVELPEALTDAVEAAITAGGDKPALRLKALDLYEHLRTSALISASPATYRERAALLTSYDPPTSLAYLAGLMPSVYGATVSVLSSTKQRLDLLGNGWEPDRFVDYGSGTGSAAWAIEAVWGGVKQDGTAREYIGFDSSRAMIELSSGVLGALPVAAPVFPPATFRLKLTAVAHQLPLPATTEAMAKLQLSPASSLPLSGKKTVALASFLLGDLASRERRKEMVNAMWDSGAEVIVLIDRGTPAGNRYILEAREQLLALGRKSLTRERADNEPDFERGSFVLSPCPHDGDCPLHHSTRSYCHFSQRVRSPPFLRHTKHTTRGEDDAKFSFVVIQRGTRPISVFGRLVNETTGIGAEGLVGEEILPEVPEEVDEVSLEESEIGQELEWPRLVAPPLKRSGHVILEVCASSGEIERHTIPKSQGRQEYYDARKVRWGDSFPHAPKNGAMVITWGKIEKTDDKFGKGKSKLRSKKADRTGRGDKIDVREGRQNRHNRGSPSRGSSRDDDAGGVQDYELEIGEDGQLKIMN